MQCHHKTGWKVKFCVRHCVDLKKKEVCQKPSPQWVLKQWLNHTEDYSQVLIGPCAARTSAAGWVDQAGQWGPTLRQGNKCSFSSRRPSHPETPPWDAVHVLGCIGMLGVRSDWAAQVRATTLFWSKRDSKICKEICHTIQGPTLVSQAIMGCLIFYAHCKGSHF